MIRSVVTGLLMGCVTLVLGQSAVEAKQYRIKVHTGTAEFGGTDADVYIKLYGKLGTSAKMELDNGENNFERGQTDTFDVEAQNLGKLQQIRIWHNNQGFGAGWFLDKVVVEDLSSGETWTFPCNGWLALDEAPRKLDRILPAR